MFARFVREIYGDACYKGFYDKAFEVQESQSGINQVHARNAFTCQMLLGVVAEVSEAYEALREGNLVKYEEEVTDAIIRLFSLCGYSKINLDATIPKKLAKNRQRPRLHKKIF